MSREWRELRRQVLAAAGDICQAPVNDRLCGAPATGVRHIVLPVHGGASVLANLRAVCRSCSAAAAGDAARVANERRRALRPVPPTPVVQGPQARSWWKPPPATLSPAAQRMVAVLDELGVPDEAGYAATRSALLAAGHPAGGTRTREATVQHRRSRLPGGAALLPLDEQDPTWDDVDDQDDVDDRQDQQGHLEHQGDDDHQQGHDERDQEPPGTVHGAPCTVNGAPEAPPAPVDDEQHAPAPPARLLEVAPAGEAADVVEDLVAALLVTGSGQDLRLLARHITSTLAAAGYLTSPAAPPVLVAPGHLEQPRPVLPDQAQHAAQLLQGVAAAAVAAAAALTDLAGAS